MRHTSLALAIALQLGSFAVLAETSAVPALPVVPVTAATTPAVSAAPATAVTPTTAPAVKATALPDVKPITVVPATQEAAPAAAAKTPCTAAGMMTPEERTAHREKLRSLEPEARHAYMEEHRAMMQTRMRDAMGITGDANPPPNYARPNPLMTSEERDAHREKLRTLTGKDRDAYLDEHYAKLRERAQKIAEADDRAPPMPDFEAQRKRIMEMRDALRREMEEYRAKMQEFGGWQGAPNPEMGQMPPWGVGPQGWGAGPQQGWRQPGPGYGPWGVMPDGGYQPPR